MRIVRFEDDSLHPSMSQDDGQDKISDWIEARLSEFVGQDKLKMDLRAFHSTTIMDRFRDSLTPRKDTKEDKKIDALGVPTPIPIELPKDLAPWRKDLKVGDTVNVWDDFPGTTPTTRCWFRCHVIDITVERIFINWGANSNWNEWILRTSERLSNIVGKNSPAPAKISKDPDWRFALRYGSEVVWEGKWYTITGYKSPIEPHNLVAQLRK